MKIIEVDRYDVYCSLFFNVLIGLGLTYLCSTFKNITYFNGNTFIEVHFLQSSQGY